MLNCQRQHPNGHKWIDGAVIIKNFTGKIAYKKISLGNLRKDVAKNKSHIFVWK